MTITANRLTSSPMLHPDTEVQLQNFHMLQALMGVAGILEGCEGHKREHQFYHRHNVGVSGVALPVLGVLHLLDHHPRLAGQASLLIHPHQVNNPQHNWE